MFDEWNDMTVAELLEVKRELVKAIQNEKLWMMAEHNPYAAYLHARNVGGYEYQLDYVSDLIREAKEHATTEEE